MDERKDDGMNEWMDRGICGRKGGLNLMDGWSGGWMNGKREGCTNG